MALIRTAGTKKKGSVESRSRILFSFGSHGRDASGVRETVLGVVSI
jgi:hypothetical protein